MKKIIFMYIFLLSLLSADIITIGADEWCPYNCDPTAQEPGYMVEIMKEVFEPLGHKIVYKTIPYSRAIALSRHGRLTALVGAIPSEVPDFIFPGSSQGMSKNGFCVLKNHDWKFDGLKSLKHQKCAVIQDYSYSNALDSYIEKNRDNQDKLVTLSGDAAYESALNLLEAKRVTVFIEDESVLNYKLSKNNLIKTFKIAGNDKAEPIYIAFSPKLQKSKLYAKILDEGINKLRKSGRLKYILNKYGLNDWE